MAGDLGRVGARVEGRRRDDPVRARLRRRTGVVEDAQGRHVDRPGQDGQLTGDMTHDGVDDHFAVPVGQEGRLAGGAEHEEPVDTTRDEVVDEAYEGSDVHLVVRGQGRADGRDDSGQQRERRVARP